MDVRTVLISKDLKGKANLFWFVTVLCSDTSNARNVISVFYTIIQNKMLKANLSKIGGVAWRGGGNQSKQPVPKTRAITSDLFFSC